MLYMLCKDYNNVDFGDLRRTQSQCFNKLIRCKRLTSTHKGYNRRVLCLDHNMNRIVIVDHDSASDKLSNENAPRYVANIKTIIGNRIKYNLCTQHTIPP